MNQMTRIIPLALAMSGLLMAGSALAQPPGGGHDWHHRSFGAEEHLAKLDEALDLSDEQSEQLLPILQEAEANRRALHERVMEAHRTEICALMEDTHAQILAVLTAEQAEEFEDLKAERLSRFERRFGDRGMGGLNCDGENG